MMAFVSIRKKFLGFIKRVQFTVILFFFVIGVLLSFLLIRHFSRKLEEHIINALNSKGRMLVLNNSLSMQGLVEDNAFSAIQNLVARNVAADEDVVYGIYMDSKLQPWVMVTPDNVTGKVTEAKDLQDSMSIWAHTVNEPAFKKTVMGQSEVIEFAAGVITDGERVGTVRYGISTASLQEAVQANKNAVVVIYGLVILVVVGTGLVLFLMFLRFSKQVSRDIIEPINELTLVAGAITNGDYAREVTTITNDEIGILADNFNKMRLTIKEYTENLEKMVAERTRQLELAQQELVEKAHQAGMADIATGILHNVGNILNSVKTSAQVMYDLIKDSQIKGLKKANGLLREHIDSLEEFLLNDPKGKKLMQYYLKLEDVFVAENNEMHRQLRRLNDKVDAIVEVIAAQQSYVGTSSLIEEYPLVDIVEDALTMQSGSIERYGITVIKEFHVMPKVPVQKVKLVHILINLINNAKEAMLEKASDQRKLFISIDKDGDASVYLRIKDTGQGIAEENLQKVFSHGYTTKKNGHGFGLHSSANYMTEMHGEMWAESEGIGKGATFILKFPGKESEHSDNCGNQRCG